MKSPRLLDPDSESGAVSAPSEKFEDLLGRLEQIVSDMENAELPLEKLLSSYEEGMRLVKACGDRLVDAEQKVEILSRSVAPAAPVASAAAPSNPPASPSGSLPLTVTGDTALAPEKDDEIRLI